MKNKLLICFILLIFTKVGQSGVITDGSLGEKVELYGEFTIMPELGQQHGQNLFHSFEKFQIETGEIITFASPPALENIIARVTGKEASLINGMLRSRGSTADLVLINPHGVQFGANAQIDLTGGLIVTTANTVYFEDENAFHADLGKQSLLSVADPFAFGFLEENPAPIILQNTQLQTAPNQLLAFIGGDIRLDNTQLKTPAQYFDDISTETAEGLDSGIALFSVGSPGRLSLNDNDELRLSNADLEPDNAEAFKQYYKNFISSYSPGMQRGNIILNQSVLEAQSRGQSTGTIYIRGGDLTLNNHSVMTTDNQGEIDNKPVGELSGSGFIWIEAEQIYVHDDSQISSNKLSGQGLSGNIFLLAAKQVALFDNAQIKVDTYDQGLGGIIFIYAPTIGLYDRARIHSDNYSSYVSDEVAGIALVAEDEIRLQGTEASLKIKETTLGLMGIESHEELGQAPPQLPEVNFLKTALAELQEIDAVKISTDSFSQSPGGDIFLKTANLFILSGGISSNGASLGPGGEIIIEARDNIYLNEFAISTSVLQGGHGGRIILQSPQISIINGGIISASAAGGNAGNIHLLAEEKIISDNSFLSTQSFGPAEGGNIFLESQGLSSFHNSVMISSVSGLVGSGGKVTVSHPHFFVTNNSYVFAQAVGGNGGDIFLAANNVISSAESYIDASSKRGVDGEITVQSPDVSFSEGVFLLKSNFLKTPDLEYDYCLKQLAGQLPTEFEPTLSFTVKPLIPISSTPEDILGSGIQGGGCY